VTNVSWYDAVRFCNALSEREKIAPSYLIVKQEIMLTGSDGYRLPTEAEWEYACRAGAEERWCFDDGTGSESISKERVLKSVGKSTPNRFGLYDMHGNAWEWCEDYYSESFYNRSPIENPSGPERGNLGRVMRSGSFLSLDVRFTGASFRIGHPTDYRYRDVGFRVVRSMTSKSKPTARHISTEPTSDGSDSDVSQAVNPAGASSKRLKVTGRFGRKAEGE
jgi:formylglycine-generating enzyme required for sulfatase activity